MTRAICFFLLVGLLAGCKPSEPEASAGQPPAVIVQTTVLAQTSIQERVRLPASVVALPERSGSATPSASARILTIAARVGESVRKGDVIATLQMEPAAEAEVRKAGEAEALASHEAARQARLFAAGVTPRVQLEQARAAWSAARADYQVRALTLAQARANARLRAPLSGTVATVNGTVGAIADPTQPLVTIVDLAQVGLVAEGDAATLARLRAGMAGHFETPASTAGRAFVRAVDPSIDSATQRGRVLFVAENPAGFLKVGLFTHVEVVLGQHQALRLRASAAVPRDGYEAVFVVTDGHASERRARLGPLTDGWREVLAGISAGERVVVEGAYTLADGAAVTEAH